MNDQRDRKNEDWMEAAERIGNQVARGIEVFGDKVQKALEHLDEVGRPPPRTGVTVEDRRAEPAGVELGTLLRGDVFELDGNLLMRLGSVPGAARVDECLCVNLRSGDVRALERDLRVEPVRARVVVDRR